MKSDEAIALLLERFPSLKARLQDTDDLTRNVHIAYSVLGAELLENSDDRPLLNAICRFIDELACSYDSLLEEVLVIDLLETIAQDPELAREVKAKVGQQAAAHLERVEKEYFGRRVD